MDKQELARTILGIGMTVGLSDGKVDVPKQDIEKIAIDAIDTYDQDRDAAQLARTDEELAVALTDTQGEGWETGPAATEFWRSEIKKARAAIALARQVKR